MNLNTFCRLNRIPESAVKSAGKGLPADLEEACISGDQAEGFSEALVKEIGLHGSVKLTRGSESAFVDIQVQDEKNVLMFKPA